MLRGQVFILLLLSLLFLLACGKDNDDKSSEQRQEGQGGVVFDTELSEREATALSESISTISDLPIDGSQIRRFAEVFGGNSSSHVAVFFDERVNYALSASTELENRLVITSTFIFSPTNAETLASNPSLPLWYFAKINEPSIVGVLINNEQIPVDSSRIGLIQVGEIYPRLDSIQQATTLVHEARHSDCTGGALASDLDRYRNGELPINNLCGHLHVKCPENHPYENEYACDEKPWGAYVIGAMYAVAVSQTCSTCSGSQRTTAEAMALDSLSRALYDIEDLFNGRFGPPDMSSSNAVKEVR